MKSPMIFSIGHLDRQFQTTYWSRGIFIGKTDTFRQLQTCHLEYLQRVSITCMRKKQASEKMNLNFIRVGASPQDASVGLVMGNRKFFIIDYRI
jgi:hypothetical protein